MCYCVGRYLYPSMRNCAVISRMVSIGWPSWTSTACTGFCAMIWAWARRCRLFASWRRTITTAGSSARLLPMRRPLPICRQLSFARRRWRVTGSTRWRNSSRATIWTRCTTRGLRRNGPGCARKLPATTWSSPRTTSSATTWSFSRRCAGTIACWTRVTWSRTARPSLPRRSKCSLPTIGSFFLERRFRTMFWSCGLCLTSSFLDFSVTRNNFRCEVLPSFSQSKMWRLNKMNELSWIQLLT